jgi:DNA segregation ATPase FtsK/SpoIIIE-like protein
MKLEHLNEIKGIVILALSLILLASLISFTPTDLAWFSSKPNFHAHNWIGIAGAYGAGIFFFLIGYSAYFLVGMGIFFSWNKFTSRDLHFNFFKFLSTLILFTVAAGLFSFFAGDNGGSRFIGGGIIGVVFSGFLVGYFQPLGALIILFTLGALALVVTGEFLVSPFFIWLGKGILQAFRRIFKGVPIPKIKHSLPLVQSHPHLASPIKGEELPKPVPAAVKPNIHIVAPPKSEVKSVEGAAPVVKRVGEYHLPSMDLLNDPPKVSEDKIQERLDAGRQDPGRDPGRFWDQCQGGGH